MTRRTESARQALDQYCLSKGEPLETLETGIIDLLTNLFLNDSSIPSGALHSPFKH